jgi:DNA-binding HxlR family transcriptional regulator
MIAQEQHVQSECLRVGQVLARVGDKWSMPIMMMLRNGPLRFGEIRRLLPAVSQRILTLSLRSLERDGLVSRTEFNTKPPRVDYALTELGHSLRESMTSLGTWAHGNIDAIEHARENFDQRG